MNTPNDLSTDGMVAMTIIKEFLRERRLNGGIDRVFYSPAEWKNRGEDYGIGSMLIITYDGSDLRRAFNMDTCYDMGSYEIYESLQKRLGESGFFFEECTNWYAAVYKN
jgi:hypothetical protein